MHSLFIVPIHFETEQRCFALLFGLVVVQCSRLTDNILCHSRSCELPVMVCMAFRAFCKKWLLLPFPFFFFFLSLIWNVSLRSPSVAVASCAMSKDWRTSEATLLVYLATKCVTLADADDFGSEGHVDRVMLFPRIIYAKEAAACLSTRTAPLGNASCREICGCALVPMPRIDTLTGRIKSGKKSEHPSSHLDICIFVSSSTRNRETSVLAAATTSFKNGAVTHTTPLSHIRPYE